MKKRIDVFVHLASEKQSKVCQNAESDGGNDCSSLENNSAKTESRSAWQQSFPKRITNSAQMYFNTRLSFHLN